MMRTACVIACCLCLVSCSSATPGTGERRDATSTTDIGSSVTTRRPKRTVPSLDEPQQEPALTVRSDGKAIDEGLPFIDMDASLIDQTWLGAHDEEGEVITGGGLFAGGTPYCWRAWNGTGDRVFEAIVRDGRVIKVNKDNLGKNYWAVPGQILDRELPDRTASGAQVDRGSCGSIPDDPTDYDSPDEYADNNSYAFAANGASDPWQSAYDYWCGNAD